MIKEHRSTLVFVRRLIGLAAFLISIINEIERQRQRSLDRFTPRGKSLGQRNAMHHAALEHVPLQRYANPFAGSGPAGGSVSVCVSVQNNLRPGQAVAPELSLVSLVITEKWLRTVIAHASLPWNAMTARYHDASSLQQRTLAQCTQQRCLGVYPFIGLT